MIVIGILIGIAEIVLGIIALVYSESQPAIIGAGIGYILSGILFIWLCAGAHTAFNASKNVNALEKKVQFMQKRNKCLEEALIAKGLVNEDDLTKATYSHITFKEMEVGFPLITLKNKVIREGTITIPAKTKVFFLKYDEYSYSEVAVIVEYLYNGEMLHLKYGENDVINAYAYDEKNSEVLE